MTSEKTKTASGRSTLISPFYPALDGLRAVAFLIVYLFHYCRNVWPYTPQEWGWIGVDLFFVLSGFLITGILWDSLHKPDYFRTFYIRRSLRIFPLFYGFWLAALVLTPLVHLHWNGTDAALVAYVGNFSFFRDANDSTAYLMPFRIRNLHSSVTVQHLWSLCVEEQFYLMWPAVIRFVRSRRALLGICIAAIVICPIARSVCVLTHPGLVQSGAIYMNTFARIDTLLVGAALALLLREDSPSERSLRFTAATVGAGAPLLLLCLFHMEHGHPRELTLDPVVTAVGFSLVAFTSAAALLGAIGLSRWMTKALQWKPLAAMGRISYGLYFFHFMPLHVFGYYMPFLQKHHAEWLYMVLPLLFSIAAAWLSFRYFESPFLRLKSKLAPDRTHVADPKPMSPAHVA